MTEKFMDFLLYGKSQLDMGKFCNNEAFQGVKAIRDTTSKTSDT